MIETLSFLLSTLNTRRTDNQISLWSYMHLKNYLTTPQSRSDFSRERTHFESICSKLEPQRHLISIIYSILFADQKPKSNLASSKWERDLSINLSDIEWGKIYTIIHKGSINVNVQENGFKLFSRWYNTPLKLNKINPGVPSTCWRCNKEEGSLLHIWWDCPLIRKFWTDVFRYITQITTIHLEFSPAQALLHHSNLPMKIYHRSLAQHLINAAKLCIPTLWKSTNPPTIANWIARVNKIALMEEFVHQAHDSSTKFRNTWACWQQFQTTSEYTRLLY